MYHFYVGWVANEVGRHRDAETALAQALELDRGLADAYWQRGRLRRKQGAVKDAIADLEHALSLKPSLTEALADIAVAYADLGQVKRAIAAWEEALSRDGDRPKWLYRYGKLLSANGQTARAVPHVKRAIDLVTPKGVLAVATDEDGKPPVWLWQAHYLVGRGLGMVQAAVPHWEAYLHLAPADNPYRREAERALASLGHPYKARR
jgi:tetratricopeptide (TPR) repeat protein